MQKFYMVQYEVCRVCNRKVIQVANVWKYAFPRQIFLILFFATLKSLMDTFHDSTVKRMVDVLVTELDCNIFLTDLQKIINILGLTSGLLVNIL